MRSTSTRFFSVLLLLGGLTLGAADLTPEQQAAKERIEKFLALNPAAGGLMFSLAKIHAQAGRSAEAISWLNRALDTGIALDPAGTPAFAGLHSAPGFQDVLRRAAAGMTPVIGSTLKYRLLEKDIEPEGIAYDPVGKKFYLGSIRKCKIIAVDADGTAHDFAPPGQSGLMGVLGMKVDAGSRHLWVNANTNGAAAGSEAGSGLFEFDLPSGRLLRKYLLDHRSGKHLLNDLVLTPAGDVFLTDSESGFIYRAARGSDRLEIFAGAAGEFMYLNGITCDESGERLYISDFLKGISILEIATRKIMALDHKADVSTLGIDGLYYDRGSLLAIQNANGGERVLRFFLDGDGRRVAGLRVLDQGNPLYHTPMTGVIVDRSFCFVAYGRAGDLPKGPPGQKEPPQETVVLSLPLDR